MEQLVHELQEQLVHAPRLASLGEITSMVAQNYVIQIDTTSYVKIYNAFESNSKELKAIEHRNGSVKLCGSTIRCENRNKKRK